jgi:hypothetical protein
VDEGISVAVAVAAGVGEGAGVWVAVKPGSGVGVGVVGGGIGPVEARQADSTNAMAAPTNPRRTNWRRVKGVSNLLIHVSPDKQILRSYPGCNIIFCGQYITQ